MFESTRWWGSRRTLIALLAIVLLAATTRALLFRGYVGLDDAEYSRFAYNLSHGSAQPDGYAGPGVFPLRIGLIAPTAAIFRAFGVSEWTMVLFPFVLSLASIVLAYFCAALWFGPAAGLIAATLMAAFPMDIDCATKLLPDLPGAFFAAAGVSIVAAVDRFNVRRTSALFGAGLATGLLFGYSWLCKESIAYLAPFCVALVVIAAINRRWTMLILWAGVVAGSLTILFGEMITYYRWTGDFLFRLHETNRDYLQNSKYFFSEGGEGGWKIGQSYGQAVINRLFVNGPATIFFNRALLFAPLVALLATAYGWLRRDRSFIVPALWLWTLVLMFNFGSSSTRSYMPLALFERYMYPMFLPAVVVVAGFLARTVFARNEADGHSAPPMYRLVGVVTAVILLAVGGRDLALDFKYPLTWWMGDVRAVKASVGPETVLYADTLSIRAFDFFNTYPSHTAWTDFEHVQSPQDFAPGSLVIVNQEFLRWLDKHGGIWGNRRSGYRQFAFYAEPPRSWTRIYQGSRLSVYRVDDRAENVARVAANR
jgi:Dolichyl-phosphate-mannose-protein mannosyltransferase